MEAVTVTEGLTAKEYRDYFNKGINYEAYLKQGLEASADPQRYHAQYIPLNMQRMNRINKTGRLTTSMLDAIEKTEPQNWLVIAEHWCGDAAQTLPYLGAIAKASHGKINLRIAYRDAHPELMDAHLTSGSRSIPKLVQLNGAFELTGTWGPRPIPAQQLVKTLKNKPETAATYSERLHKWYADDKGVTLQEELAQLLATRRIPGLAHAS